MLPGRQIDLDQLAMHLLAERIAGEDAPRTIDGGVVFIVRDVISQESTERAQVEILQAFSLDQTPFFVTVGQEVGSVEGDRLA